jgi:hypothetical protein
MREEAISLMRSATPKWTPISVSDGTSMFQRGDTIMTIFPDGNWRCVSPDGLQGERNFWGNDVNDLKEFLEKFVAANRR